LLFSQNSEKSLPIGGGYLPFSCPSVREKKKPVSKKTKVHLFITPPDGLEFLVKVSEKKLPRNSRKRLAKKNKSTPSFGSRFLILTDF
jgi:hypothetical protein